ncbi:MAG: type III PLP-dependent enzyme [Alphaproteobacteria bacterium]|nr:type III PLP-dependent enzyme [Alphaproteobacteria bacterium]
MTDRIRRFLRDVDPPTPFLVVDLEVVGQRYADLREALPVAEVFYAVKANPAREILEVLARAGSNFDVASPAEIDAVLNVGVGAERLSYGNTIKKERDIAYAYTHGVRLFAFDSEAELEKLARSAPGARVFCRVLVDNSGADWPLSRKFGCDPEMARSLLLRAQALGLEPYGVAFHVGSQQTVLERWNSALGVAADLFQALEKDGVTLHMVNLGGGLPARYAREVEGVSGYAHAIMTAVTQHFGNYFPRFFIEPGRYIVGDAGMIQAEVVLVSRKAAEDLKRWVYLDIGRFGGLAETEGEAIKYRIGCDAGSGADRTRPMGPVIIAGPTCDSADVLYEKTPYELPLDLAPGDKVQIHATGAYTTTYSSVGFNGFEPLRAYFI